MHRRARGDRAAAGDQALDQWLAGVIDRHRRRPSTASDDGAALEPGTVQVTVTYTLVETQTTQQTTVALL